MPFRMTRLRMRVLDALSDRGELAGQDIAYEFASPKPGMKKPFKTPQAATRWSASYMKPLIRHGFVNHRGRGRGGIYSITSSGVHRCIREQPQIRFHEIMKSGKHESMLA
jgi:hypothetical protein